MLTPSQQNLWEAYEVIEGRAPRDEKLQALNVFLDSLVSSSTSDWFPWARSLAAEVLDKGKRLVIRRPLFERAVFPALLAGHLAELPGCARWLEALFDHLCHSPECQQQLPPAERTQRGLLRAALRHDPTDRKSRQRLIQLMTSQLRYSLHELPTGVLYGTDGASPDECQELQQEVEELCHLVAEENQGATYQDLIRNCRFHFAAYRDYLLNQDSYSCYPEYLASKGH